MSANPFTRPANALTNSSTQDEVIEGTNWVIQQSTILERGLSTLTTEAQRLDQEIITTQSGAAQLEQRFIQQDKDINKELRTMQGNISSLQTLITALQTQLNNLPQSVGGTSSKPLGVNDPEKFDGEDWSLLPVFKNQVLDYIRIKRPTASAEEKATFAISYLSGRAAKWVQPFLTSHNSKVHVPFMNDWDLFWEELEKRFGEPDRKQKYRALYRALAQTSSVQEYLREFLEYSSVLGYSEVDMRDFFYERLSTKIKQTMLTQNFEWENKTFQEVCNRALKIDNEQKIFDETHKAAKGSQGGSKTPVSTTTTKQTQSTTRTMLAPGDKVYKNEGGRNYKGTITRISKIGGMQTPFVIWNGRTGEEQSSFRTIKKDNQAAALPSFSTFSSTTTTSSKSEPKGPAPMELDGKGKSKLTCHTCGGRGHFANQCPSKPMSGHEAEIESDTEDESGKGDAQTY